MGAPVPWEKLSGHVQRMMSVMGWLGHQYIWHQVFAAQHDLAYMPHPLRDFFAYDFLERVHLGATSSASFAKAFTDGLAKFQGKVSDSLARLGAQRTSITLNLPGLLPVVVRECTSKDDFLTVLGQLRGDQKVIELREMLNAAQNSADHGNFTPLAKIGDRPRFPSFQSRRNKITVVCPLFYSFFKGRSAIGATLSFDVEPPGPALGRTVVKLGFTLNKEKSSGVS
jgi:hypothetical protein